MNMSTPGVYPGPRREIIATIASLHPATLASLLILSVVSGYFNYLSAAGYLSAGMAAWQGKAAAGVFALAVSTVIMLFWMYMLAFVPTAETRRKLAALLCVLIFGCTLIMAISSWMNASALIGVMAQQRDLAAKIALYREAYDAALRNALAVRRLSPYLETESRRFLDMSACEKQNGCLTGSGGIGAVTATLDQVAGRLDTLHRAIAASLAQTEKDATAARAHLKAMQDLVGRQGDFEERLSRFADHALALEGTIARLSGQSVLPAVKQTADALGASLVMPASSARNAALARKQEEVMAGIQDAVREVARRLIKAASEIAQQQPVEVPPFTVLSRPEATLVYARDFLPAWFAAVSIDLMPLTIVLVLTIVRSGRRGPSDLSGEFLA